MKAENVYKIPIISALISILIAVPLRIYQYFTILESDTGFYSESNFTIYIIYALLAVASIISIAIPLIFKKKITTVASIKNSPGVLVVSLIMAVTVIIDSAKNLITYFDLFSSESIGSYTNVSEYVKSQGGSLILMQIIFGAASAVFFFVYGISVGVGNSDGSKMKILALAPTVWTIFKLLYRFKRTISFVNVSDLLFELFLIVFMMMYFLAFAQVISKIDAKYVFFKLVSYGVPAIIFASICFIPRFIVFITGNEDKLNSQYTVNYSDFGFIVFALYNLIARAKIKEKTEE